MSLASDRQAEDIVMLDIRRLVGFSDYFIIATINSLRQLESLEEHITRELESVGIKLHHREGNGESGWVLLDYSDVIVHIFGPEERDYYQLEKLWAGATQVVRML